jgi:hypothetical protein
LPEDSVPNLDIVNFFKEEDSKIVFRFPLPSELDQCSMINGSIREKFATLKVKNLALPEEINTSRTNQVARLQISGLN